MELKIYSPQDAGFIQRIDWNFEELKAEITAAAQEYETSVYTDDTIKAAKADRAKLNKFVDALEGKRTEIRKKLLEPDELFGQQVKELTGIVQRAIKNIDGQVKDYEERQRKEKLDKVREFYVTTYRLSFEEQAMKKRHSHDWLRRFRLAGGHMKTASGNPDAV